MRVAIFGGTGFVGSYIVDALLDNGHEPSLLVRAGSGDKLLRGDECRITEGDIESPDAVREALEGCGAAIYLIGILREFPKRGITYERLQYRGVVRVVDNARNAGVDRLLLMSANGAREDGTPYQSTKYRAEQFAKDSDLDVTVFRPSIVFGDPRGTMEFATQLYRQMVRLPLPAAGFQTGIKPGDGPVELSPVHAQDVADAFVHALGDESTVSKTYTLGGPDVLSFVEMLRRIGKAAGKDKIVLPMPIGLMKVAATLLDWLPFFPATRDQLTMLAEGNTAEPDELRDLIGREPEAFTPDNLAYLREE